MLIDRLNLQTDCDGLGFLNVASNCPLNWHKLELIFSSSRNRLINDVSILACVHWFKNRTFISLFHCFHTKREQKLIGISNQKQELLHQKRLCVRSFVSFIHPLALYIRSDRLYETSSCCFGLLPFVYQMPMLVCQQKQEAIERSEPISSQLISSSRLCSRLGSAWQQAATCFHLMIHLLNWEEVSTCELRAESFIEMQIECWHLY